MVRNLRCTVTIDSVLANYKTQNAFLFTVHAIFRHDYPLAVEPTSTPKPLVQKKTLRDSLPIDMLLSVVSVLVVAQSSSEIPEGLVNNPVYIFSFHLSRYFPSVVLYLISYHSYAYYNNCSNRDPSCDDQNVLGSTHCMQLLCNVFEFTRFLVAFAKLRKETISFVISVCLSVRPSVCPFALDNSALTGRILIKFNI